jgi:hypothetical protein
MLEVVSNRSAPAAIEPALEQAGVWGSYFAAFTELPEEPGWAPAVTLASSRSRALDEQLQRIADETCSRNGRVLSAFVVHRYAWRLAAPAASVYLAADALPDVGRYAVWLKPDADPLGIAYTGVWGSLRDGTFVNRADLETWFRTQLTDHLAPLVAELRSRLPLGERAMWVIAADACASAFLAAGEQLDDEARAVARIRSLLLDPPGTAFGGRTSFFTIDLDGRTRTVVRRGSCCQSFRVDGAFCSTCPRVPETEQRSRVYDELTS